MMSEYERLDMEAATREYEAMGTTQVGATPV